MKKNLTNLIIVSFLIYVIIGEIYSTIKSRRYDIDFKHPMIYRIKSIPYDEYATYESALKDLETMLNEERNEAESIWNDFYQGEYDTIIDLMDSISLDDLLKYDERTFKPLKKHKLNTIQKIILIEDYLIQYPEGLRQLDKYLAYYHINEIKDKIKESILSDIKTPNILEIWVKKGERVNLPWYEFDDTLDVENYQRVNKLFDSLFRIYELKNNYHNRYGKKNNFRPMPIDSAFILFEKEIRLK